MKAIETNINMDLGLTGNVRNPYNSFSLAFCFYSLARREHELHSVGLEGLEATYDSAVTFLHFHGHDVMSISVAGSV